jgi:hypothetical protein
MKVEYKQHSLRLNRRGLDPRPTLDEDDSEPSICTASDSDVVGKSTVCYPFLGTVDNPVFCRALEHTRSKYTEVLTSIFRLDRRRP